MPSRFDPCLVFEVRPLTWLFRFTRTPRYVSLDAGPIYISVCW